MATRGRPRKDDDVIDQDVDVGDWEVPLAPSHTSGALQAPVEEQSPAERIAAMLENASGIDRTKVSVYRVGDKAHSLIWANNYTVEEFESGGDLQLIRSQFGPGRYSIRIFGPQAGSKRMQIISRLDLDILADPNPAPAPVAQASVLAAPATSPELLQVLSLLTERLSAPTAPPVDPMAQMTAMLSLMKMARDAFGPTPTPPAQKSLVEQLTELRALQEVAGELAPKGDSDKEPSLLGLGAQMMDMVRMHTANQAQQMIVVPPVRVPVSLDYPSDVQDSPQVQGSAEPVPWRQPQLQPQPQPAPQPAPQPEAVKDETMMTKTPAQEAAAVQQILSKFVKLAEQKAPADEGAALLYGDDQGNEGLPDQLFDVLLGNDWWEVLSSVPAIAAQLSPHEPWVREVRAVLYEWAIDEGEDEVGGVDSIGQRGPGTTPTTNEA